MDTITQGLLGAATAQLGFRQRIGRDASLVATAAAVLPDLDIFITPLLNLSGVEAGDFAMMRTHRGLSHSLFMVPVIALVVTSIWWWFRRAATNRVGPPDRRDHRPTFMILYGCVFAAVLSHPLLDWCTSYGTQLFLPATDRRYAIDAVAIIDIIYTPILILTLLTCYLVRKLKRNANRASWIIGAVGFALSVVYLGAGYAMNRRAVRLARASSSDIGATDQSAYKAYPQLGTIFVWRVTVRTADRWLTAKMNVLFTKDPAKVTWQQAPIVDNEWTRKASQLPQIKLFDRFAMGQLRATYVDRRPWHRVDFHDMRYGPTPESITSLWSMRVVLDRWKRPLVIDRIHHYRGAPLGRLAKQAWRDIFQP